MKIRWDCKAFICDRIAQDHTVYLTFAEPGGRGSGLALASATLAFGPARLDGLKVIWREFPKGRGGQLGGAVAISPDRRFLFLSVGDRQRMVPAQDPSLPQGKILRLTLDGKPAPGNPHAGALGASHVALTDPQDDTEAAKSAPVVARLDWPGPNRRPSETWAMHFRTPLTDKFRKSGLGSPRRCADECRAGIRSRIWRLNGCNRGGSNR